MKLGELLRVLEQWAPPSLQESYDNSGLIVGDHSMEVTGALVTLDCIESVIDEAIDRGCNLVIAHHPIVFGGIKRFNGKGYVQRTVMKAIKHDVAIYAIHTNLDSVNSGVNAYFCELLGIKDPQILSPKKDLLEKLVVFTPQSHADSVRNALFEAGAGEIGNYDECSFNTPGQGTFRGGEGTNAFVGEQGKRHVEDEVKIEVIVEQWKMRSVLTAMVMSHPYEEVAYDRYQLKNEHPYIGSGMIGELEAPMDIKDFFDHAKKALNISVIKHTKVLKDKVQRIALCGGSGFFLLGAAKGKQADVYITSDIKYHQFFDAEDQLVLADIGHWESEHRTSELIQKVLKENFPTFAVHLCDINTNPVNYY
ncbi:Nif3-like dinuclear metal center hexameric protein [Sanyastnella coralliicola]|uniref:Nif3-like dinuclear metal center hexameric protein n=1 Tax=Sanyastnella coralliicola TaxID=3069118 RepID=UPI0027B998DB|nr:Nif3-like dinuclear metal center hexameric protein [Longitalea sp. SCSIO 12813]